MRLLTTAKVVFATLAAAANTSLASLSLAAAPKNLAPIVFVPGLGGSVLEAQLNNRSKHRDCAQKADWYTLWFSEVQVLTRVRRTRMGRPLRIEK